MILIFGAGGQVGQELAARLAASGMPVSALPRDRADISDERQVAAAISAARPSIVINAAAYNYVDRAETEPDIAMRINADGPAILAEQCLAAGLPLVHFSTDYVFDGEKDGAYRESDPPAPINTYGRSKLAGEEVIRARLADHLILRVSWIYGRHGKNFLKTMLDLAGRRDALQVVADQRGCPTAATDIVDAVVRLVPLIAEGGMRFGTYHFAGYGGTTRYDFAREIIDTANRITGRSVTVTPVSAADYPAAARRPTNSVLDCTLFERAFGFRPRPWREATREVVTELCGKGVAN